MRKKVKVYLKSNGDIHSFTCNGIVNNNIVNYIDDDNNKISLDLDRQILTKKNGDLTVKMIFSSKKESYYNIYYNERETLREKINVKHIIREETFFEVEYTINDNHNVIYKIELIN